MNIMTTPHSKQSSDNTHNTIELASTQQDTIINWVHSCLCQAIVEQSSDIHFEPYDDNYRIRYRIDGRLLEKYHLNFVDGRQAIARLKIMAHLDTAEYRFPQDGHFKALYQNEPFNLRLSTCPTNQGEKIVIRVLNHHHFKTLSQLDLTPAQQQLLQQTLNRHYGLILVCGPTGSGKTTTLYSILDYLNQGTYNIVTAEDPTEINLTGINQVSINPKIGLHFDQLLQSFLRQDPDIIMVGEIRDQETAAMAIKAAQTGHLVLATLHSYSTTKAFTRLKHLGISHYDILEACQFIMSQRLLPHLCAKCAQPQIASNQLTQSLQLDQPITIYNPLGCQECHEGYKGRFALYEMMTINDETTYQHCSLAQSGLQALYNGQTTYQDLLQQAILPTTST